MNHDHFGMPLPGFESDLDAADIKVLTSDRLVGCDGVIYRSLMGNIIIPEHFFQTYLRTGFDGSLQ